MEQELYLVVFNGTYFDGENDRSYHLCKTYQEAKICFDKTKSEIVDFYSDRLSGELDVELDESDMFLADFGLEDKIEIYIIGIHPDCSLSQITT